MRDPPPPPSAFSQPHLHPHTIKGTGEDEDVTRSGGIAVKSQYNAGENRSIVLRTLLAGWADRVWEMAKGGLVFGGCDSLGGVRALDAPPADHVRVSPRVLLSQRPFWTLTALIEV